METNSVTVDKPLDLIGDVESHWELAGTNHDRAFDGWLHFSMVSLNILEDMSRQQRVAPWQLDRLAFAHDVSETLKEDARASDPRYVAHDEKMWHGEPRFNEKLGEELTTWQLKIVKATQNNGRRADVEEIFERGHRTYSDEQLLQITEAALASRHRYLTTGERDSFWPAEGQGGRELVGDWDETKHLEHIFTLAERYDAANGTYYEQRLNQQAVELAVLYAKREYIGRAIAQLATLTTESAFDQLMPYVADTMLAIKDDPSWVSGYYQSKFTYAEGLLKRRGLTQEIAKFRTFLQPSDIPLIEGATREIKDVAGSMWLIENFAEHEDFTAHIRSGETVTLPFEYPRQRAIMNYGEDNADTMYDQQYTVNFETLPEAAQAQLRMMQDRSPLEAPAVELQRLVFGMGETLHTMAVPSNDGQEWHTHNYGKGIADPVENKHVTGEVETLEHLSSNYLVTEYDGSYNYMQGYSLRDFHPDTVPEGANAFWFSGMPLEVRAGTDGHFVLKSTEYGHQTGKYMITPIEFYRVEAQPKKPSRVTSRVGG